MFSLGIAYAALGYLLLALWNKLGDDSFALASLKIFFMLTVILPTIVGVILFVGTLILSWPILLTEFFLFYGVISYAISSYYIKG